MVMELLDTAIAVKDCQVNEDWPLVSVTLITVPVTLCKPTSKKSACWPDGIVGSPPSKERPNIDKRLVRVKTCPAGADKVTEYASGLAGS
jgi:hypothetical protein